MGSGRMVLAECRYGWQTETYQRTSKKVRYMFYNYLDTLVLFRKLAPGTTRDTMYSVLTSIMLDPTFAITDTVAIAHMDWEERWHLAGRPFYRVWPKVMSMLLKLDLSAVPASFCRLPRGIDQLLIQLPSGNGLADDGGDLQTIIVGHVMTRVGPGVSVGSFDGKLSAIGPDMSVPLVDMWVFPSTDEPLRTVLDSLRIAAPLQTSLTVRDKVLSLVTTLCLLDSDPELIAPYVLTNDEAKAITQADIDRLSAKARRRGRYGWDVGKSIEVMPHYRRPHTALFWTGEGRKVPVIRLRKGALVHRSKIESIPTGYLNDSAS